MKESARGHHNKLDKIKLCRPRPGQVRHTDNIPRNLPRVKAKTSKKMFEGITDDTVLLFMLYTYSTFVFLALISGLDAFQDIGIGPLMRMACIFCCVFIVVYPLLMPYLLSLLDY
ncbi:hypothetical protein F4818DRAFT_97301 [Hypoxylon cercidicola]|nr:hypothetical protein F4818DRAFT_97301 [Hypoxylon cercidicola]